MVEMKITYEPFKEIVVKDYIKFEKLNDLIYAFAQLRAVGQPVARAFIPLEKATNMRRLSCKSMVVTPPSQKMRLQTVKPIMNIPNAHNNVATMLGLLNFTSSFKAPYLQSTVSVSPF